MIFPARVLDAVSGEPIPIPDPYRLVHLQLRRFAGCPVCHLHLRSFVRRIDEIEAAGVQEVVVFHSTAADLRPHVHDLPFPVVADPHKSLYVELGVESSYRAIFDPHVWPTIVRALWQVLRAGARPPALFPTGGRYGLPADLLIAPDGTIVASKHGTHADDQWSVDTLLALAHPPTPELGTPDTPPTRSRHA